MPLRLPLLIEIETEEHGSIALQAYFSMKNVLNLEHDNELSAREFVVKALHELIHSDTYRVEDISSWSDTLLENIVRM